MRSGPFFELRIIPINIYLAMEDDIGLIQRRAKFRQCLSPKLDRDAGAK